jgi:hypothetical protein
VPRQSREETETLSRFCSEAIEKGLRDASRHFDSPFNSLALNCGVQTPKSRKPPSTIGSGPQTPLNQIVYVFPLLDRLSWHGKRVDRQNPDSFSTVPRFDSRTRDMGRSIRRRPVNDPRSSFLSRKGPILKRWLDHCIRPFFLLDTTHLAGKDSLGSSFLNKGMNG